MSDTERGKNKSDWLQALFGVRLAGKPVPTTACAVNPAVAPPPSGGVNALLARPRSGDPILGGGLEGTTRTMAGAGGKRLGITQAPDGRVVLTAPPPPVREITLAGGGGKGAALPGAVRALHDSGVLDEVKQIHGASVGSMTASLVAAGCTPEELEEIANDPKLSSDILGGRSMLGVALGPRLDGKSLQATVRGKMDALLRKRITGYLEDVAAKGNQPDPSVLLVLERLADGKRGPTFGDLRILSKVIPTVKELSISASYMAEINPATGKPDKGGKAQLAIFSADTEPDMEVAVAVNASAALPPVFEPVDITLSSGLRARFQDGGVLNNVPSTDSIGDARDLDPMPTQGSMSFVFEDDAAHDAMKGVADPVKSTFADWLTGAPNSAANYETYRGLADKPEDMVIVPLKFSVKGKKKDFSGLLSGTVNFDIGMDDRLKLQEMTAAQTAAHIQKRQEPKARSFDSMEQMLMCVDRADLVALVADGLEGAKAALDFRDAALAAVADISARAGRMTGQGAAAMLQDPALRQALAALDAAAGGNVDRQGFVAREMNRGGLDRLIDAAQKAGEGGVLGASAVVADALKAKAHAVFVLREMIYPRLVDEDPKGVHGTLLAQVGARLRAALSALDINDALTLAIKHFRAARDLLKLHGYRKFADDLSGFLMPAALPPHSQRGQTDDA